MMGVYAALFIASAVHLVRSRGWRQGALFFWTVYLITLAAEIWAQEHGLFGVRYFYDAERWPGPLLGALPFFVPCMWFAMMVPTYSIADELLGRVRFSSRLAHDIVLSFAGAVLMTAWDLLLDPVSVASGLWRWEGGPYPYYDVPYENLASWLIGTFGTHLILRRILKPSGSRPVAPGLIYAGTAFAYLPVLPDARLAWVVAAMAIAGLLAAKKIPARLERHKSHEARRDHETDQLSSDEPPQLWAISSSVSSDGL